MDVIDDDICILTHEKADCTRRRDQDIPFSASSGEASVASHFALVTAYEDIKKRLKETEKDNYSLKKRLRLLEEMICGNNTEGANRAVRVQVNKEWPGSEQVNKAYSAYREICIERDQLRSKLEVMEKDKTESTKTMNDQLQSKELELLQVKSELETHQVMKSLSKTPSDWEIEKLNSELKLRSVEQELKLLQEECRSLRAELQRTKDDAMEKSISGKENHWDPNSPSDSNMRQAYWELKKEMSNLHLVTEVQTEVLRKLKATVAATKKVSQDGPVQCEEDLAMNCRRPPSVSYEKAMTVLTKECKFTNAPQTQDDVPTLYEKTDQTQWTIERPIPVGGTDSEESDSFPKSSFEENSWVMPSPPKPSETLFWETKNNLSPNYPVYYSNKDSQKYLYKS
ncbi:5-azacytidine-induced protein 2 [Discoglossus pictus]